MQCVLYAHRARIYVCMYVCMYVIEHFGLPYSQLYMFSALYYAELGFEAEFELVTGNRPNGYMHIRMYTL